MNAIVLDLETIPDLANWQPREEEAPLDPTQCSECHIPLTEEEKDVRKCTAMKRGKCRFPKPAKEGKDEFPPPHAHQIVVLGALVLKDGLPTNLFAWPTLNQEAQLLEAFAGAMGAFDSPPAVVTWNGGAFDLQVIQMRSLIHGVSQAWFTGDYRNRYTESHNVDLANILGGRRGDPAYMKLDTASRLIGLPGKQGMDGSMIRALVEAGQLGTATTYCLKDVVQTAFLYLRYRLVRGICTKAEYQIAAAKLAELATAQPGFEDFPMDRALMNGTPF